MHAKLLVALLAAASAGIASAESIPVGPNAPLAPQKVAPVTHSMTQWQAMADYVAGQLAPRLQEGGPWAVQLPERESRFGTAFATMLTSALTKKGVVLATEQKPGGAVVTITITSEKFAPKNPHYPKGALTALTGAAGAVWLLNHAFNPVEAAVGVVLAADAALSLSPAAPEPSVELAVTVTAANGAGVVRASETDVFLVSTKDPQLYEQDRAVRSIPLVAAGK